MSCGLGCNSSLPLAKFVFMLALAVNAAPAAATGVDADPLSFHAFGTLGIARTSNDQADFIRDRSQPNGSNGNPSARNDSIVGVQVNYRPDERFDVVVQGVSHYRYDGTFSPELTWAFLKVSPTPELALRFGRIGTEFFMLADSRMVGYSYLTVRPPVDFFGTLPFNYVDGVDGRYTRSTDWGLLSLSAYGGVLREKVPAGGGVWDLGYSRMSGVSLELQKGPWQGRASFSRLRFDNDGPMAPILSFMNTRDAAAIAAADALKTAGSEGVYRSIGVTYDDGNWQASAAWNSTHRSSALYEDSRSGYLLVGRHLGGFTPYAGYSWTHSTPKSLAPSLPDPYLGPLNAAIVGYMKNSHQDQYTLTLGGRWDFQRNMDIKAQVDLVRGTPDSYFLVQQPTSAWNGRSTVMSVALDFFF